MTTIALEVIGDAEEWLRVRDDWSAFLAQVPVTTPFQLPAWQLTWWQHFGSGQLKVLVFKDPLGEIVGLIPCFLHEWEAKRQFTLVGSGISDYLEPAIKPEYRAAVRAHLSDYLTSDNSWDTCHWQDLDADSALVGMGAAGQLDSQWQPDTPCSEILLSADFEEYWNSRPGGLRRNVKRYSQKAGQSAEVQFSAIHAADPECFDALIRLHGERWREQGETGMINANRSAGFLREVTNQLARGNMALFFSLRFEGQIVAVILTLPYRNVLFAYLSAFDPSYSELGFGRILLFRALRYAFSENYSAWNFLRGNEPYKSDWGARTINKSCLRLTRNVSSRNKSLV